MSDKFKTKSALSWFGSDSQVAEQLGAMLDHCKHVTIPFVGGAAILPFLKARAIVANDLNDLAINFYHHMSGANGEAARELVVSWCHATLSHPTELAYANEYLGDEWRGTWLQAWAYWAVCWLGRKGKGGTGERPTQSSVRWTTSGGTNASRLNAVTSDLGRWAKEFRRCEFTSVCFRDVLSKVTDKTDCGVYCDPPWVGIGRRYVYAFKEQDHVDLADLLRPFINTTIVLRYGDDPLIRGLYSDWEIIKASSRTQANKTTPEIWLRNRRPA